MWSAAPFFANKNHGLQEKKTLEKNSSFLL